MAVDIHPFGETTGEKRVSEIVADEGYVLQNVDNLLTYKVLYAEK